MVLTPNQRRLMEALASGRQPWVNAIEATDWLRELGFDTPPAGIPTTASSLIRRGLIEKAKIKGIVHYRRVA